MRSRHDTTDETLRLAVELHAKDQEELQKRLATEAAMEEASVPPEYLRRAEEMRKQQAEAKAKRRQVPLIFAACLVPPLALAAYLAFLRAPSTPIEETFASAPELRWTLETSPGTHANVAFQGGRATIKVDNFAVAPDGTQKGRHWATLRSIDGRKNLRTLNQLTFRARGEGLSRVRFRFVEGKRSWVTPAFLVDGNWKDYRVSLGQLDKYERKNDTERSDGAFDDRVRSSVAEIQIQTGSFVNPLDAKGTLEVDDVRLK